ncbi:MAG: phosphoribosylanthranilate isomerase [Planctomycetaceae bacterium]
MWVKICGVRDEATAEFVSAAAPDAIGLNFHPPSPRCVEVETAARIVRVVPKSIAIVGVFVNASADDVLETCAACGIEWIQLHGDERPPLLAELKRRRPDLRLIRAFRFGADGLAPLVADLDECARLDAVPEACLIDAHVPGSYGGTGRTVAWDALAGALAAQPLPARLILAGGLTAENVADSIAAVRPWGVDVAGGVESSPGVKDADRVTRFLAAARGAS